MRPSRRGLLALGAVAALPAAARAQPPSDATVLEELLVLERRLESAYAAALRRALSVRGRRVPPSPRPDPALAGAVRSREAFGRYALGLEGRTLSAYVRAVAGVRDTGLRRPLGAIMANEAQHEVALREWLGTPRLGV